MSKGEKEAAVVFVYMQYSTLIATNYKGFERSLLMSENHLRENHENQLQNRYFAPEQ